MRASKTWIVVANSECARMIERDGLSDTANTVVKCRNPEMKSGDITYDAPLGRVFDSHGAARHSIEPRHERGEIEQRQFAKKIARILEIYAKKRSFDHLVVIAGQAMLGALRREFGRETARLITSEIDKNVTKMNVDSVLQLLDRTHAENKSEHRDR